MMKRVTLLYYFILFGLWQQTKADNHTVSRQERGVPPLLFPPTTPTRTQWIVGIGIPVENLLFEAITTGYVLKAEYFLPETVDQLKYRHPMKFERSFEGADSTPPTQIFSDMLRKKKKAFPSYRWTLYKGLEGLAARMGLPGRACVLKSVCEAVEVPFHDWNGVFGELLYILLTPSSSADNLSEHADNEFFHAELVGRSAEGCARVFKDCPKSLLDHFSEIYSLKMDMQGLFI